MWVPHKIRPCTFHPLATLSNRLNDHRLSRNFTTKTKRKTRKTITRIYIAIKRQKQKKNEKPDR